MSKRTRFVVRCVCIGVAIVLAATPAFADEVPPATETDPDVVPPRIILGTQKAPVYPPAAFAAKLTGSVTAMVTIDKDGSVRNVKVTESSHPKLGFEQATIKAIKAWRFEPATRGLEPVEYSTQYRLNFRPSGISAAAGVPGTARPPEDRASHARTVAKPSFPSKD